MIFRVYSIVVISALVSLVRCIPVSVNQDAQACMDLCTNCKGIATFADDKCECEIGEDGKEGAECLRRMRREVGDNGFNLISCDLVDDDRKTRCTLGSKHFRTRTSIDQVAKYFMKDGPITGSIFKAPPYTVRSKINDCGLEKAQVVSQPMEIVSRAGYAKAPEYSAPPPQQVIINIPQGYAPSDTMTGSSNPEPMTGGTRVIIQPKIVSAAPAAPPAAAAPVENVGSPHIITQPKELIPEPIVEAPHIITQPAELIPTEPPAPAEHEQPEIKFIGKPDEEVPEEKPKVEIPKLELEKRPVIKGKDYSSLGMYEIPKTVSPLFMQSLLQHLSQPMLGIPQAVQTITKAPGISQIVSAPGNLLNSLVSRLDTSRSKGAKSKGNEGGSDDSLKFATNSLFSNYNPDLFKLYVNPGDDFNTVLGSKNPYSNPSTHILVHPISAYRSMPVIQSPVFTDYAPYDVSELPTYMVGSPLGSPYFDSDEAYIPIFYDIPQMDSFINEATDPNVEQPKTAEKEAATPIKEIYIEIPATKPKKICKKSSKDESSKKVTRDVKADSQGISEEVVDTNEKNKDYGITQATELPKIDRTTTLELITEKTPDEETKHSSIIKKTEIPSKIKKLKRERKSHINKN